MTRLGVAMVFLSLVSLARAEPPRVYGGDGQYLGSLSANPYDPESLGNPYGRYGNPYAEGKNPYGRYQNPYSPDSMTNPYAPWGEGDEDGEDD